MNFNNCINLLNVIIPTFPSEIEKKTPKDIFQKNRVTACLQNAIKQSPSHLKDDVEQLNKKWGTFCSKVLDTEQIPENAQKKLKKLKELISTIYHKHTFRAANQSSPNHSTPNHSSPEDLVLNFQRTGTKALLAHKFPTTLQYLGRIFKKLKQKEYGETLHEEYNSLSPLVTTQESLLKFVLFELALDAKDQNGETLQNQQNFFNTFLPEVWKLSNKDQKIHLISLINMLKDISLETFEKILIGKEESVITKYMNDLTAQAEIKRIEFNELVSLCSSDENINQYITRQTHNNIPHSLLGYFPQSTVTLWLASTNPNHLNNNNSIPLERPVQEVEVEVQVERPSLMNNNNSHLSNILRNEVPRPLVLPEDVFRDILMESNIPTSLDELSKIERIEDAVRVLWQRSMTHRFPIIFLQGYLLWMRESSREVDPEFLLDIPTMEKIINALLEGVSSNFNHSSINNNFIHITGSMIPFQSTIRDMERILDAHFSHTATNNSANLHHTNTEQTAEVHQTPQVDESADFDIRIPIDLPSLISNSNNSSTNYSFQNILERAFRIINIENVNQSNGVPSENQEEDEKTINNNEVHSGDEAETKNSVINLEEVD